MDFKIVDVFAHYGQVVFAVEHYNPDGSFWHLEHYTFQGREFFLHKRVTDAAGKFLLDDGTVAPERIVRPGPPEIREQYLPDGRAWRYHTAPQRPPESVLNIITAEHQKRRLTGWQQGNVNTLSSFRPARADQDGCAGLVAHFQGLKGRIV